MELHREYDVHLRATDLSNTISNFRPNEAAVLKVLSKDKDSIMVKLDPPAVNENCLPEKYHLEYSASGQKPYLEEDFDPADVEVRYRQSLS